MTEDMALSDSVSGVSRSGRVRKKSAKLMEMEDLNSPFYDCDFVGEVQKNRKKTPGKIMSPTSTTPNLIPSLPPFSMTTMTTENKAPAPSFPTTKRKPASQLSPAIRGMPHNVTLPQVSKVSSPPPPPIHKGERVITIKQLAPPTTSFETLSGSAYLMGDDIHFITGEPVDSCGDSSNADSQLSPLKIDVGGQDEPSVALQEDGLKMKFILSPKAAKVETAKGKKKMGTPGVHGKSVSFKKLPSRSSSKSKKKKPVLPSVKDMSALDVLASGGIMSFNENLSLAVDSSEEDDVVGESKLIIAEPHPIKTSGKSKRKGGMAEAADMGASNKRFSTKPKKKKSLPGKSPTETDSLGVEENVLMTDLTGQQHSVYLKEKNSSKKKSVKKLKKPKNKGEKKQRPISAYMLWAREYRKVIVRENPGIDFASISRRQGEIWKSMSDKEKLNWRRKAKLLENKTALITTGTNVGESDRTAKSPARPSSSKSEDSGSPRDVHKPVGTTPLDVAAHLKLLGESLSIIGQRLTEHEGQIAVSGSLSVLLDSTLCALGPLMCLTSEVDQLNGCPKETMESVLDNIAYIMPGL